MRTNRWLARREGGADGEMEGVMEQKGRRRATLRWDRKVVRENVKVSRTSQGWRNTSELHIHILFVLNFQLR